MEAVLKNREVRYGQIAIGETFIWNGMLYQKSIRQGDLNTACLTDGRITWFGDDVYVSSVEGKFIED